MIRLSWYVLTGCKSLLPKSLMFFVEFPLLSRCPNNEKGLATTADRAV